MSDSEQTPSEQSQPVAVSIARITPPPWRMDWERIRFGFLTRLFGYGGISSLILGFWVSGVGLAMAQDAAIGGVGWILVVVGLALCFAAFPRLGVVAPPALLLVGIIDGVIGVLLRIVSIPLIFFSGLGMVTNLVGIRLGNAGRWIRAHRALYERLRREYAGTGSGRDFNHIADGMLPGTQDGFWGAEGDSGPLWILWRQGENLALINSGDSDSAHSLTREQINGAKLIARKRFESSEVGKLLLAFPQEHALVFPFQLKTEGSSGLTLLIGHEAAATFARWFYPDNLEVRKLAARTSRIAIASLWLGLLGPPGLIVGIYSLIRIHKSNGWLKGQYWAWAGIAVGTALTGVVTGLLLFGPGRGR